MDAQAQFRQAMAAYGLEAPANLEPGRRYRFPGKGKSNGNQAGWCKLFDDAKGGIFGDWSQDGLSKSWQAERSNPLSPGERAAFAKRIKAARREAEAARQEAHDEAAGKAATVWKSATSAEQNPYLKRKGCTAASTLKQIDAGTAAGILGYLPKSGGEMLCGPLLVVPVKVDGHLSTLELIDADGHKTALAGGQKAGGFWATRRLPDGTCAGLALLIGEGVATCLSAAEATGCPAVAALSCGNLKAVAKIMRARYPKADLVVLSDLGNGEQNALEAAKATGARLAKPDFGDNRKDKDTDFNDLARLRGPEAVKACINAATAPTTAPLADEWPDPEPLPDNMPAVEPFTYGLLPAAFRPWVRDVAERIQCPPDFPAVSAMVALSAVVGRQAGIRPKAFDDWLVVPNLWGGVIGRPGVMKTPALAEPMRPINKLQAQAREAFDGEKKQYEAQQIVREAEHKFQREKIAKAVRGGKSTDALVSELVDAQDDQPTQKRYVLNDSSVEKAGEILADNPNGVILFRDELVGFLRELDREGKEGARAFWLEAWNGTGSFVYDRIGRGTVYIEAACVSILGGIQPGPLQDNLRQAINGGVGDDGLLQRFQLLVWPDIGGKWTDVDRWPNSDARKSAYAVFDRLSHIDPAGIGATVEEGELPYLRFDPTAQAMFKEWRAELETRLRNDSEPPPFEAHLSKYRSLVPTLALLFHLVDTPQAGAVGEDALLQACAWAQYLESHARRVYAGALDPELMAARELDRHLCKGDLPDPFTAREVIRKHWRILDRTGTKQALVYLQELGRLVALDTTTGGRPTTHWRSNPKAYNGGAA